MATSLDTIKRAGIPIQSSPSSGPKHQSDNATRDCEIGILTIVNTLQYSPVCVFLNIREISKYLRQQLPLQVRGNLLNLQPTWDYLLKIPGVQEDVLKTYFQELSRQHLPWQLQLPKALRAMRPRQTTAEVRSIHASDLLRRTIEDESRDGSKKPVGVSDWIRRSQQNNKLRETPLGVRTISSMVQQTESQETPPSISKTSNLSKISTTPAIPKLHTTSTTSAAVQKRRPRSHSTVEIGIIRPKTIRYEALRTEQEKPYTQDSLQEGIAKLLSLLSSSPISRWVNQTSFRMYLERRLEDYITANILDLEPLWDNLSRIPAARPSELEGFIYLLIHQDWDWKYCLPHAIEDHNLTCLPTIVSREDFQVILEKSKNNKTCYASPHSTGSYAKILKEEKCDSIDDLLEQLVPELMNELETALFEAGNVPKPVSKLPEVEASTEFGWKVRTFLQHTKVVWLALFFAGLMLLMQNFFSSGSSLASKIFPSTTSSGKTLDK